MLATFVIGLREGLEAALIVSIVAAFLRRNGKSLVPMWLGVALAVLLSIAVGVTLRLVEQSLPQAAQEAMETVIGAIAVVFVTGMIMWMSTHSRGLKHELEAQAADALGGGTARALALMAFLAVLKEGFETAVFLLATFQASTNAAAAATGAVLGILVACGLGYGIYSGGVSLDLGKFFRYTTVFLVLVAAGLVVTALRTAHEAGWLDAGQRQVMDLTWLAPGGSIRGALVTGVLGIPAQPRLVEVLGWFAYLVPVALVMFWPRDRRPSLRGTVRLQQVLALVCLVLAGALALLVRTPSLDASPQAPVQGGGTVTLHGTSLDTPGGTVAVHRAGDEEHQGAEAVHYTGQAPATTGLPATLTVDQLRTLAGGRLPIGVDPSRAAGPFAAAWDTGGQVDVWTTHGALLDASAQRRLAVTITGGGLATARTVAVSDPSSVSGGSRPASSWQVEPGHVQDVARRSADIDSSRDDVQLWGRLVPLVLVVAALGLLLSSARRHRRLRVATTDDVAVVDAPTRSTAHAR